MHKMGKYIIVINLLGYDFCILWTGIAHAHVLDNTIHVFATTASSNSNSFFFFFFQIQGSSVEDDKVTPAAAPSDKRPIFVALLSVLISLPALIGA